MSIIVVPTPSLLGCSNENEYFFFPKVSISFFFSFLLILHKVITHLDCSVTETDFFLARMRHTARSGLSCLG